MNVAEKTKPCTRCERMLPLNEFHRRQHYVTDGVRSACKRCTAIATANSRRRRPPAVDARKALIRMRTRRAIEAGVLTPQPCAVCGVTDVQPHHPDYERPQAHLHVEWLCVTHHALVHGTRPWTRQLALPLDS